MNQRASSSDDVNGPNQSKHNLKSLTNFEQFVENTKVSKNTRKKSIKKQIGPSEIE
jgi:hypothetical protein